MQFLSRFSSSKSKDPSSSSSKAHRRHSTPPPSAQSTSYLPLDLPSSSLLRDDSLSVPFGISPKPSRTQLASQDEEGIIASGSSRSVDTQPWVEIQGGQGGEGSPRIGQQSLEEMKRGKKEDLIRARKECVKLEKARIGQEQMITLMDECGETIRSRGLTTLGIFRPYRSSESLPQIRKLSLLFLDYSSEFSPTANSASSSTRGTEASKTVKLHRFKEELRFAEIHDLVSVLKWGLRHFTPSSPFSLSPTSSPPFEFYRSFLSATSRASYPHSSFSAHLLPLLPPQSQSLLISTLTTIQSVSAFSEQNAMTSRRLCRLIGYYLFAPPTRDQNQGWEVLYEKWRESGMVLEGCLKAFLWEQDDLPPRLQELVNDFGRFVARSRTGDPDAGLGGRKVRVLRVEVVHRGEGWKRVGEEGEGVNDQETGYLIGGQREGRYARRRPIEIMLDAFEAVNEASQGEETDTWGIVREKGKGEGWKEVLDDETVRVFDLLGLSTTSSESSTAPSPRRHQSDASPFQLSALEESPPSGSPSFSNFPNRSVAHFSSQEQQNRVVTPSWTDFTQTGFSTGTSNLSNEFGQFKSELKSSSHGDAVRRTPRRGESKIVKIEWMEIDEEFSDVWLDTLVESTTTSSPVSSWPSILVAPFRPSLLASLPLESSPNQHLHLFIYEKLLPLVDAPPLPPAPVLQRNQSSNSRKARNDSSETSSLNPRKWTKRASSIFGSRREPSSESTPTIGALGGSKDKKQSRKSMVIPDLPPPIPIVSNQPRRSSMDPTSSSPQPYSTSPAEGNVITRTISKTMARRKSRSSIISSPTEENDRQLPYSSPPKFEAELVGAPVPAIPAKYSMEHEEAKRRSQASPVIATTALEEEDAIEEKPVKESAVPLVPPSISPPLPETPLKEVLLQGQPILGAVNASLLNPSPSTENAIPLADSPTISRAAAIRTPSSEAGSLLLHPIAAPINDTSSSPLDEAEILSTPAPIEPRSMETVASPTFTLSPPGGEPETLPPAVEDEVTESEPLEEGEHEVASTEKNGEATNLGLGLSNVEEPPFEQPEIVQSRESIPSSPPRQESTTPASPSLLATPTSTTNHSPADPEVGQDSPTIPIMGSPTPSSNSQGSTSKKFLARTRSFLTRKKSSSKLDQEREKASKAEAKQEKELRRIQENESRKSAKTERQAPTPVSSVKKRVAELNQIANTNGSPNSITPSTSFPRLMKVSSPTPASPSPLPSSDLPQPGSAASSIVPLPAVNEPQQSLIEEEEGEKTSVLQPEHAPPEVIREIEEDELATEFGSTPTDDSPFARPSTEISESQPESTIPSVTIDEPPTQETEHLEVKVPSALEDLPSPLPSPTPQSDLTDETPILVSEEDVFTHSRLPDSHDGGSFEPNEVHHDAPSQEASHLAVKVPSHFEDLPSSIPSPSPLPEDQSSFDPLTSEPDSIEPTETILPIPPTLAVSPTQEQDISDNDLHQRDPSSSSAATVVDLPDQDEMDMTINHQSNGDVPRTPSKQTVEPHDLSTPTAPTPPIFHSSPSSSPHGNNSQDPFIDSTPVKQPPLVSSQSNFSISTRNSTDTFETAAVPSTATSANASAASSIHNE